ncbi:hypothetical protein GCM10027048_28110 [Hymenobacter coalescens]
MAKKVLTGPLKAYEVFFCGERYGTFVGRSAGQAKARLAADLYECYDNNQIWPYLKARLAGLKDAASAIEAHEDRGKYWKDTKAFARLQAEADAFNAKYPIGSEVRLVNCHEAYFWRGKTTKTRTPAWVPSLSGVLVSIEGEAGGFGLEYIQPVTA